MRRNVSALVDTRRGLEGRRPQSLAEATALLAAAESSRLHAFIVLCLLTGVRSEEARALTWEHVDLEAGTISVWRSVRAHGDTKTNRSRQTLKLPEIAAVGAEGAAEAAFVALTIAARRLTQGVPQSRRRPDPGGPTRRKLPSFRNTGNRRREGAGALHRAARSPVPGGPAAAVPSPLTAAADRPFGSPASWPGRRRGPRRRTTVHAVTRPGAGVYRPAEMARRRRWPEGTDRARSDVLAGSGGPGKAPPGRRS